MSDNLSNEEIREAFQRERVAADARAREQRDIINKWRDTFGILIARIRELENYQRILKARESATGATPGSHTHVEADVTDLDHDAVSIQTYDVQATAPADLQVLMWDAGDNRYEPTDPISTLPVSPSGSILVSNGTTWEVGLPVIGEDGNIVTSGGEIVWS